MGVEDLPLLPEFLQDDLAKYQFVLAIDPAQTQGVPSHDYEVICGIIVPWRLTITVFAIVWFIGCMSRLRQNGCR